MKTMLLGVIFGALVLPSVPAFSCPLQSELNRLKREHVAAKPKGVVTTSAGGPQSNTMGTAAANAGNARAMAAKCQADMTKISQDAKKKKDQAKEMGDQCKEVAEQLEELEQASSSDATSCASAGGAAGGQEDKNKDNKDKMGKGDDKGGGGAPPQMPQIPPKEKEKKEDLLAKERERQAKIKECKARVNNAMEIRQKNCEYQYPYNPAYPVGAQKQKQDECKQTVIFSSQAELAQCEYDQNLVPSTATPKVTGT